MLRIESPHGRLYKTEDGLILPSVTTVVKATAKKPFSREVWAKKLTTKGLSEHEASIFTEFFIERGYAVAAAFRAVEQFIDNPMTREQADCYMDWKSPHSSRRGTRLHEFLEKILPVDTILDWKKCPECDLEETQLLVDSLWEGEILQQIKRVHSLEQRLWWYCDGIGYAGTEDINFDTWDNCKLSGDWKSKDPKHYCPTNYSHENKIQLIAYAGARFAREGRRMDGLNINYCFSSGIPGVQTIVTEEELSPLWNEWILRLKAWWGTIGKNALTERNA
jgi:hypothetical protein